MKSIISIFFFLISSFLPINSFALETIEILGGKASMIPIAVTPFHEQTSLTKNQTQKINQIIDSDLRRSGLFDPLNVVGVGSYPREAMEVNYSNWSAMQAQFLILGKIEADDIDKNKIIKYFNDLMLIKSPLNASSFWKSKTNLNP